MFKYAVMLPIVLMLCGLRHALMFEDIAGDCNQFCIKFKC